MLEQNSFNVNQESDYKVYNEFNKNFKSDSFDKKCCTVFQNNMQKKTRQDAERIEKNKLRNLNKTPSIEDAVFDYKVGYKEAFEYIYNFFYPKIEYMAMEKSNKNDIIYEDLVSEICFQLLQCVDKYNGGIVKFNTFFWRCAQNAVGLYFTRKNAKKRANEFGVISLDTAIDIDDKTMQELISDERVEEMFHSIETGMVWNNAIKPLLTQKEIKLFELTSSGYSTDEIGEIMCIPKTIVYRNLQETRKKIRDTFTESEIKIMLMKK